MADHIVRCEPFELDIKEFLGAALAANLGAREELAKANEDDLSFYIANLDVLPPGIVLWIPERYTLQDGWHRLRAAIHLNRSTFRVIELTMEQVEARLNWLRSANARESFHHH
jgi:ParB-like chromosome segregation protein Spo0J